MLDFIAYAIFLLLINQLLYALLNQYVQVLNPRYLHFLYIYHVLFAGVYYYYVQSNASDSYYYYRFVTESSSSWMGVIDDVNGGVHFFSYPFVRWLGFSYEMAMVQFAWFGYWGFVFAYLWFLKSSPIRPLFLGFDFLTIILFLPNMHFWTASLGKGSIIFLGLMLIAFSSSTIRNSWPLALIGGLIVFLIRPQVLVCMAAAATAAAYISRERIGNGWRFPLIAVGSVVLVLSLGHVFQVEDLESIDVAEIASELTEKTAKTANDLARSGSGIDMNSYSYPFRLFTIWFRPLFIDTPNFLGLFSSMENLLYLIIFFGAVRVSFFSFLARSSFNLKFSAFAFLLISIALAMVMSNLGIILRQKSMMMYFGFLSVYCFWAEEQFRRRFFVPEQPVDYR